MKKMTQTPVVGKKAKRSDVMALIATDRKAYSSHFKREPLVSKAPKYYMIDGVPHKMVNGAWVAMTPKVDVSHLVGEADTLVIVQE